jgi:hypothetical protein
MVLLSCLSIQSGQADLDPVKAFVSPLRHSDKLERPAIEFRSDRRTTANGDQDWRCAPALLPSF